MRHFLFSWSIHCSQTPSEVSLIRNETNACLPDQHLIKHHLLLVFSSLLHQTTYSFTFCPIFHLRIPFDGTWLFPPARHPQFLGPKLDLCLRWMLAQGGRGVGGSLALCQAASRDPTWHCVHEGWLSYSGPDRNALIVIYFGLKSPGLCSCYFPEFLWYHRKQIRCCSVRREPRDRL